MMVLCKIRGYIIQVPSSTFDRPELKILRPKEKDADRARASYVLHIALYTHCTTTAITGYIDVKKSLFSYSGDDHAIQASRNLFLRIPAMRRWASCAELRAFG